MNGGWVKTEDYEGPERRKVRPALPVLLLVILLASGMTLIAGIVLAVHQQSINDRLNQQGNIAAQLLNDQCVRGNAAVHQQLAIYDGLISSNQQRTEAWRARPYVDAAVARADQLQIEANQKAVHTFRKAELSYVAAREKISKYPLSPDLHKRAIADCARYFAA